MNAPANPYESEARLLKVTKIIQFLDECVAAGKLQRGHLLTIKAWGEAQWTLVCAGAQVNIASPVTRQMVCERILARLHWANADRTVAVGAARSLKVVEYARKNH